MRGLLIFMPKISLKIAKWEKKISYKHENSAKDFAKISRRKFKLSRQFCSMNDFLS